MALKPWQEVGVLFVRGDAVTHGPTRCSSVCWLGGGQARPLVSDI